jgi:hypothetical protein
VNDQTPTVQISNWNKWAVVFAQTHDDHDVYIPVLKIAAVVQIHNPGRAFPGRLLVMLDGGHTVEIDGDLVSFDQLVVDAIGTQEP